jgi:Fur family transcriptional regulator, ferric uptake regulator
MKELEQRLLMGGIKPTAMRLLVLEYLLSQTSAKTITEIEIEMGRTDRVTLFRTVKTFEEKCLVHRVEDGSGAARFALCRANCEGGLNHEAHAHFFCKNCEQTFCLAKVAIPEVSLPSKFRGEEINLTIKGICERCC